MLLNLFLGCFGQHIYQLQRIERIVCWSCCRGCWVSGRIWGVGIHGIYWFAHFVNRRDSAVRSDETFNKHASRVMVIESVNCVL